MSRRAKLMPSLTYGRDMRPMEWVHLRAQDIHFDYWEITVRAGKWNKDHIVPLPDKLNPKLRLMLKDTKTWHEGDLKAKHGEVPLPVALARKCCKTFKCQCVFPVTHLTVDYSTGRIRSTTFTRLACKSQHVRHLKMPIKLTRNGPSVAPQFCNVFTCKW